MLEFIETQDGVRGAPVLQGMAVLTFAGKQQGVTLSGVIPAKMRQVTTIDENLSAVIWRPSTRPRTVS